MDTHVNFRKLHPFYDDINYPKGFSKCGDFTIAEAQTLEDFGRILSDLSSGKTQPKTKDEVHFTQVCLGKAEATTYIEKLWAKYQELIRKETIYHSMNSSTYRHHTDTPDGAESLYE